MLVTLPLFWLLLGLSALGSPKPVPRTTLQLTIEECRNNSLRTKHAYKHTIRYKRRGDAAYRTIVVRRTDTLTDMRPGDYLFKYEDSYFRKRVKPVSLTANTVNSLRICLSELPAYAPGSIGRLQEGETIVLNWEHSGCFTDWQKTLTITKAQGQLLARLENPKTGSRLDTVLNGAQIDAFNRFENELEQVRGPIPCTSSARYRLQSRYKTVDKEDRWCQWDGFGFLCDVLFGDTPD